jgi:hypothetical protein
VEGADEGGDDGEGAVGSNAERAGFDPVNEQRSIAGSFSRRLASFLLIVTHDTFEVHSDLHLLDSLRLYDEVSGRRLGDEGNDKNRSATELAPHA